MSALPTRRQSRLSAAAQEKLLKQSTGDYGLGRKYEAVEPGAGMYGVYSPLYAQSLAATTGAAGADLVNQGTLQMAARNEREAYERQLAQAQAAQLAGIDREGYYGLQGKILDKEPDGLIGMRSTGRNADGSYGVFNDPIMQMASNEVAINAEVADTRLANSGAIKNMAEAGIRTDPLVAGGYMTHPLQSERDVFGVWNDQQYTPDQEIKEYSADEGLNRQDQFDMERLKAQARIDAAKSGGAKVTKMYGPDGTYLGTKIVYENGAEEDINDIPTGPPGNPKAGASGGAAPAKPAVNAKPVSDAKVVTASLFPGINITEHRRDPNSALGRKNPGSWHNKSGAAVDVKPVKGMTFEQFVGKYKQAGYQILEARDEVKNPSGHATGPHWHVVLGENTNVRTAQGNPTRVGNLQVVAQRAQKAGGKVAWDNGTLVVTTPSGKQLRYGP